MKTILLGLLLAELLTPEVRPPAEKLPFIADDYPRALATARQKKVPIFAEAWAPW